ncbi:MAG TPA: FAD-binding oxidoreductase [Solirubrobacteraceae bacterium]|jgi:glycolate oxidase subunit GlcD|nr:FAD-binding oxidoreductase [Solirubrobacteraceae bacterium]
MRSYTELSRIVGAEHVLEAPPPRSPYNQDASRRVELQGRADAVVLPGSAEEVAAVVRWCYAHDTPIVPRGGGTGLTGGAVPTEGGVVCSLERLRAVRELAPGLWRIHPEAGVSTRHVQRLARENGLMFAPDPGAGEQSQIGGNVATNAGGPHALKYGVTGAWVTGLEAVLAPGELVRIGGWARKDVAGYDLKSLLVGSEGTLGVITSVRLRLLPAPAAAIALVVFLRTLAEGCQAMLDIPAAGIQPSALEFLDGATLQIVAGAYPGRVPADAGFALLVEVDGSRAQAQAQRRALLEVLAGATVATHEPADAAALWRWRDGFNPAATAARGGKVSEDVAVPVERLVEGLERFAEIAARHGLRSCAWGHGGEGNVHATVLVDPASPPELDAARAIGEELFALVGVLGGSIAAEHGAGRLKRGLLDTQWDERAVELHEQIKRVFDPKGLLNPGAKLARLPPQ